MRIIPLKEVAPKVFRKQNLAELYKNDFNLDINAWLSQSANFSLAAKSCDGSYHTVNSEISDIILEQAENIRKGRVKEAITRLVPTDPMHGDRFVIFKSEHGNHFFLGTIENAFMTLAEGNIKID